MNLDSRSRPTSGLVLIALTAILALVVPAVSAASSRRGAVTIDRDKVGAPGNPSVSVVPFTDAVYQSCSDAPQATPPCLPIGAVKHRYGIGRLEVTVRQYVAFLNTVEPDGRDRRDLYDRTESSTAWPKYGQIDKAPRARPGHHYSVAYPAWADKPYGFANFLRAARFDNSLFNGRVVAKTASPGGGFPRVSYRVRLSPRTERGMYDLRRHKRTGAPRARKTGFVIPSQDEWVKAAYYDPSGGGTFSYWKYPTNAGVFGDGTATAPATTTLNPGNGDVTNGSTQPLATYHASGGAAPSWCPAAVEPRSDCSEANPFGIDPTTYAELYQGSVSTLGQARTTSPWGTLDQGGNAVEWTDTVTSAPFGTTGKRVWRRLHGGIANAPAYQLWLSAIGLQPQRNPVYETTYPWLGFRVGTIGKLKVAR